MDGGEKINANPVVYEVSTKPRERKPRRAHKPAFGLPVGADQFGIVDLTLGGANEDADGEEREEIDQEEIFDLIRNINDPEHPLTLEQLNVTQQQLIDVCDAENRINVRFVPTIPHCSMATLIGLCIRVKLLRSLPPRFKVDIKVQEGSHASENQVNKQLNDKERVAAALENSHLLDVVNKCLATTIPKAEVAAA